LKTEGKHVCHFVAINEDKKQVVVSVRGTQDLNDCLTNVNCIPVELTEGVYSHEGMLVTAREILARMSAMIKAFVKDGYELLVTGHSLGAGVAGILSILLKREL